MAILKFKAGEVARIVRHLIDSTSFKQSWGQDTGPQLWLVGDHGIYLMSNGDPADLINKEDEPTKCFVAYAEGCNPNVDDFDTWWHNKREWFGDDDGVDGLNWHEAIGRQLLLRPRYIRISITRRGLTLLEPEK